MSFAATMARLPLRLGGLDGAERLDLGGGLRVALAEDRTVPLLHCQWVFPRGARHDPAGLEGLNALMLPGLAGAPGGRDGGGAGVLESLGADLLPQTGWDHATVAVELAAGDWRLAVDWGETLVSPPPPSPVMMAAERGRRISRHRLAGRYLGILADRWWHRLAYPRSRFGHPLEGTEASLARIEHRHLADLHEEMRRLPLWLIVAGCVPRDPLLARLAGGVRPAPGEAPTEPPPEPPAETPGGTYQLEVPAAPHAEIRAGHASVCRTHEDFVGLQLLTGILERRVARLLRDHSGASYRSSVRLTPRTGSSPWIIAVTAETSRVGETLETVATEVERLRDEPVPEAELREAQELFTIDFLRSLQSVSGLAATLKRWAVNEHPTDYYRRQLDTIGSLSASGLQDLAQRHTGRERLLEVVAGPPGSLSPWRSSAVSLPEMEP